MSKNKVTVLVIGAGARGEIYSRYALEHPDRMQVVGVAEPREAYREQVVSRHTIPTDNIFSNWKEAAARPKMADAVLICTQDNMHRDPAVAFADLGYHILLEKPLAPTEHDCRIIIDAVKRNNVLLAVAHVLRYTRYTQKLKSLLDSGIIGDIISMQHLEPVGYWHQAHSFVRGNWRNEAESSFMLLQKSCHDLDWIRYIMGDNCKTVSSFGGLNHFVKQNQPEGAAERCLDCQAEATCPWSACKIYAGEAHKCTFHFRHVLTPNPTEENIRQALRDGPYGRCVYCCDNDVVDHQVVNMQFAHQQSVTFTMTAFTKMEDRKTRVFGSKGYLEGDGNTIRCFDFLTDQETIYTVEEKNAGTHTQMGGHGGGDYYLMDSFIHAVMADDRAMILSGPDESLESHLMVFAAERARKENTLVVL
ncbi:TPA: Gfo/Idh/MocA family oxidoreductase [Escherichia coli]|uniref:Gfo/Idh/MocA family oxidoreductase n=1 Tax=Escherichia coli TaxID=562 RepID=A0AAW7VE04_ECOLX|nr:MULTISPECIES: Gfo/Idh/MocA family oxidoreductase [Escherichia]EMD6621940.1 Gfo/Idh/MocA family oxidoreductase [Escherichia coli]MDO2731441.1 Gfo/Idh/MocA family oxidoreductase [Escherichia coli]NAP35645.1 Gfo/Idh/MocA family oxidoreductase [Escherichia coli]NAQ64564.1 Gfo/Idh/MocA family oxidoreductase [Escherichia coli]NAQ67709.1 Gfo/Idh/MocA family oxidoreductase [Escherichia coli]